MLLAQGPPRNPKHPGYRIKHGVACFDRAILFCPLGAGKPYVRHSDFRLTTRALVGPEMRQMKEANVRLKRLRANLTLDEQILPKMIQKDLKPDSTSWVGALHARAFLDQCAANRSAQCHVVSEARGMAALRIRIRALAHPRSWRV